MEPTVVHPTFKSYSIWKVTSTKKHQIGLILAIIIQLCNTAQVNKLEYDIKTFQTLEERSQYAILTGDTIIPALTQQYYN